MKQVSIPWGNWYSQTPMNLYFPDDWDISLCEMEHRKALTEQELEDRINAPVGTVSLEEMARGKRSACIVIDDISRPTPGDFILPVILKKLVKSGIPAGEIRILCALGAHRPMTRFDMEKKVGRQVLENFQVINHNPFSGDLVSLGEKIKINRVYYESELKILVGCIVPHTLAGFSGGAKNIIPGIGGIETLEYNHGKVFIDASKSKTFKNNTLNPDNPVRENMEAIVESCGADFIVNVILNDKLQVAEAFAGHYVKAHREACNCAKEFYRTRLVPGADIVILNAYPKDTEYSQVGTAFSVLGHHKENCFSNHSSLVLCTAASEGAGYHALFGPGMKLFSPHDDNVPPPEIGHVETFIFSTGVRDFDIRPYYNERCVPVYNDWDFIIRLLKKKHKNAKVAVYPLASMQIGYMDQK